jgi:chromate reductase
MSASVGMLGGARVQYHLRQVCVALNLLALNKPEVFITNANTKFDEAGNLIDERTKNSIKRLLDALIKNVKAK